MSLNMPTETNRQAVRPQHANHRGRPAEGAGRGRFFNEHGIGVSLILTDRGTEYCETPEQHRYEVHLAVENIDHSRTKTKRPAGNRHLRALPQDRAQRVLQGGPRKHIYKTMGTLLANLNSGETASGKMVLRQDADADLLDPCQSPRGNSLRRYFYK